MNWYKEAQTNSLPDIWLDYPEPSAFPPENCYIKIIPLDIITEIAFSVNSNRKEIEEIFKTGKMKLPLILVEYKGNNIYELHDGQHRYAAYKNVFPNLTHIKVAIFTSKNYKLDKNYELEESTNNELV